MPKQALSQARILAKATILMKRHGVQAVTIRNLADQLEVTPMAIYRHFENKDDLLSALFDRFIASSKVLPDKPLPWDRWLRHVGIAMCGALAAEPDWMSLIGSLRLRGGGLHVLTCCLDVMEAAGFSTAKALEAFFAVVHLSIGAACLESRLLQLELDEPFGLADPASIERIFRSVKSLDTLRETHRIERGLDLLIAALRTGAKR